MQASGIINPANLTSETFVYIMKLSEQQEKMIRL